MTGPNPKHVDPRQLLQSELQRRCERNPRYSLRALAASLGMSHTVLSLVLSGKRPLSKKACVTVAKALNLDPAETAALIASRKPDNKAAQAVLSNPELIELDKFAVISEWYHFGILSLLEVEDCKFDSRWIGKRLGISAAQARLAMERLKRLNMIAETDGVWKQTAKSFKIADHLSTPATRKFQKQIIQKSIESLENETLDERDHTSITLAMDPSLVPYAREQIRNFRRQLCHNLEKAGKPKMVYTISVQLFPMSKGANG